MVYEHSVWCTSTVYGGYFTVYSEQSIVYSVQCAVFSTTALLYLVVAPPSEHEQAVQLARHDLIS
jgi:hypothetical protein